MTILIALLTLLWLFVCAAVVGLCRAAAAGDAVNTERNEGGMGSRMSAPRSASSARA